MPYFSVLESPALCRPLSCKRSFASALAPLAATTLFLALAACGSTPIGAGSAVQELPPDLREDPVQWSIAPYASHLRGRAEELGDISITRTGVEVMADFQLIENCSVAVHGAAERARYSMPALRVPAPYSQSIAIRDLDRYEIGVQIEYQSSEQWTHLLYGNVSVGMEPGAKVSDSTRSAMYLGSRYAPSDKLGLMAGVAAFTQLEGRTVVSPLLGIDWAIDPAWQLTIGIPETSLRWAATDALTLGLSLDFEFFDDRLDSDGPLAGATLTNELVTLGLRAEWQLGEGSHTWLFVGTPIHNQLKLRDRSGATHIDVDVEPELSIGVGIEWQL